MLWTLTILVGVASCSVLGLSLFGEREIWDLDEGDGVLATLKKRRERLLRSIKDLETEFESGALSREEFNTLRHEYKRRAILASKELDAARRIRLRKINKVGGRAQASELSEADRSRLEALVQSRKQELKEKS